MSLQPGEAADRYLVEGLLGQGGMATVYKARHAVLGSRHALKVLSAPTAAVRQRLLQEGRAQARLRHPNVVPVTDIFEHHGAPVLVMDLIEGPDLARFLHARGPLPLPEALALFDGVLSGVLAAHEAGLVHRDLKPANVLLDRGADGALVPRVSDFGLVKALGDEAGPTRAGTGLGTPAYMAPEQLRDARGVDRRADLYSLGAILYRMVTGADAFPQQDLYALMQAAIAGHFVPAPTLRPDLPAPIAAAIEGCLRPDRERRIADVPALRAVLAGAALPPSAGELTFADGSLDGLWADGPPADEGPRPTLAPISEAPGPAPAPASTWGGSLPALPRPPAAPSPAAAPAPAALPPPAPTIERPPPKRGWVGAVAVGAGVLALLIQLVMPPLGDGGAPDRPEAAPPAPAGPAAAAGPQGSPAPGVGSAAGEGGSAAAEGASAAGPPGSAPAEGPSAAGEPGSAPAEAASAAPGPAPRPREGASAAGQRGSAPADGRSKTGTPGSAPADGRSTAGAPGSAAQGPGADPAGAGSAAGDGRSTAETPASPEARIEVSGGGMVQLIGEDGRVRRPGPVPPGRYDVKATFGGVELRAAGRITVADGEQVRLQCNEALSACVR